jgi:hypothetical protein
MLCAGAGAELTVNRLAEDKWYDRFTQTATHFYNEMGLLSISFVIYTAKDGQLTVDV